MCALCSCCYELCSQFLKSLSNLDYPFSLSRTDVWNEIRGLWKENSACSACGDPLQDLNLFLDCPASEPLRKSIFGFSLFLTYGPDLGVWPNCWVFAVFLRAPIPRKGSGSTTTTDYRSIRARAATNDASDPLRSTFFKTSNAAQLKFSD